MFNELEQLGSTEHTCTACTVDYHPKWNKQIEHFSII